MAVIVRAESEAKRAIALVLRNLWGRVPYDKRQQFSGSSEIDVGGDGTTAQITIALRTLDGAEQFSATTMLSQGVSRSVRAGSVERMVSKLETWINETAVEGVSVHNRNHPAGAGAKRSVKTAPLCPVCGPELDDYPPWALPCGCEERQ